MYLLPPSTHLSFVQVKNERHSSWRSTLLYFRPKSFLSCLNWLQHFINIFLYNSVKMQKSRIMVQLWTKQKHSFQTHLSYQRTYCWFYTCSPSACAVIKPPKCICEVRMYKDVNSSKSDRSFFNWIFFFDYRYLSKAFQYKTYQRTLIGIKIDSESSRK